MIHLFSATRLTPRPTRIPRKVWVVLLSLPLVMLPNVLTPTATTHAIAQTKQVLEQGMRGSAVTRLQRQLTQIGIYNGPVTGFFGAQTSAAVRRFQQAQGLPADGKAGPRTLNALSAAAGDDVSTTPFRPFQQGAQGELVRELQFRLLLLGYLDGRVTQNFDNTTKQAVMQFQRSRNLTPDGIVEQSTWVNLRNAISTAQVKSMQQRLRTAGFYTGSINGSLGTNTQQAVQAAQRVYGVDADDILRGSY